jgi:hypothetical protein
VGRLVRGRDSRGRLRAAGGTPTTPGRGRSGRASGNPHHSPYLGVESVIV